MDSIAPERAQHRPDLDDAPVPQESEAVDPWRTARRAAWWLVWGIPAAALIVGIVLTSNGTLEFTTTYDGYSYEASYVTVWPAGLVLLGTGILGLLAASLSTAITLTQRASSGHV